MIVNDLDRDASCNEELVSNLILHGVVNVSADSAILNAFLAVDKGDFVQEKDRY